LFEDNEDLHGRSIWDGKKPLRITEGKFVFRNMPSRKEGVKIQKGSEQDTSDEADHHPAVDKIDKILDGIQGSTKKLDMTLIFFVIVVVILLFLRH
jgi:hypothetical protein